jgi:site-specific DNA recombinase
MPITAAYARYSSEEQKATSIDDQLRRCRELAERLKLSIDDRRVYADSAISGLTQKRESYIRLKQDAEDKLFDVLIVDELSRLGRDMLESMTFAKTLSKLGIRLITVDGLDTSAPQWELPLVFKSFTAEQEVKQLASRVSRGIDGALLRGFQVSPPPFGYRAVRRSGCAGTEFEIDENDAAIVREIFAMRLRGQSCNAIATELQRRGVRPRGAGRKNGGAIWRPAAVHHLLRNAIYRGVVERGASHHSLSKARREGRDPLIRTFDRPQYRIVPDDTWFTANQASDRTGASHRKKWGTGRRLLSGLVTCGACGNLISIGGDARSRTMSCPSCFLNHKQGLTDSWMGYTSEGAAMTALTWVLRDAMSDDVVQAFRETLNRAAQEGPLTEIASAEKQLAAVKARAQRLRQLLMIEGLSDDAQLGADLVRANREERECAAKLSRLQQRAGQLGDGQLARLLQVDPRDLIRPLLDAPPDARHLKAVLGRLVHSFRLIERPKRFRATFAIVLDMTPLVAGKLGVEAPVTTRVGYRVEVTTSPHRPVRWHAEGTRFA